MGCRIVIRLLLCLVLGFIISNEIVISDSITPGFISFKVPKVITSQTSMSISVIPSALNQKCWPSKLAYQISGSVDDKRQVLKRGTLDIDTVGKTRTFDNEYVKTCDQILISDIAYPGGNPLGKQQITIDLASNENMFNNDYEKGDEDFHYTYFFDVFGLPSWISLLPSICTIFIAIYFRQNIISLFVGIWLGTVFIYHYNPIVGLCRALDTVIIGGMFDHEHCTVIYFLLLIGGMIGVIGKGGGAMGVGNLITRLASTRRFGQLTTWVIGVVTFFDDYASCLIAGTTMKDITGTLKISREKFSFIVDTCAATIASLVCISSWIGVELTYLNQELGNIGHNKDIYMTFLNSIPYRFYPILALFFCLMTILLDREFGPMLKAENRAISQGKLIDDNAKPLSDNSSDANYFMHKPGIPLRWINAVVPFVIVIFVIVFGMIFDGYSKLESSREWLEREIELAGKNGLSDLQLHLQTQKDQLNYSIRGLFIASSPFNALLWGSFIGSFISIILVIGQRILTLDEAMAAWVSGASSMLFAILILIHAWGLGLVCKELHTSEYMAGLLKGNLPPGLLPTLIFILGAIISFSTGSAWGTMSILFPLVIPLSHQVAPTNWDLMLANIASILSGSVWGNHTSPVADSCIMSSMVAGADHSDHVKTQAVYALFVGCVAIFTCSLPVGFGLYSPYEGLLVAAVVIVLVLWFLGQSPTKTAKHLESESP